MSRAQLGGEHAKWGAVAVAFAAAATAPSGTLCFQWFPEQCLCLSLCLSFCEARQCQ